MLKALTVASGRFSVELPEFFAQIVTVTKAAAQSYLLQVIIRIFKHLQNLFKPEAGDVTAAAAAGDFPETPGKVSAGHIGGAGKAVESQGSCIFS